MKRLSNIPPIDGTIIRGYSQTTTKAALNRNVAR
jgi:hypothetical protein